MSLLGWRFDLNKARVSFLAKLRKKEQNKKKRLELQYRIAEHLAKFPQDKEKQEVFCFLKRNEISTFPYDFVREYKRWMPNLVYNIEHNCFSAQWHGKTMYLKSSFTKEAAEGYFRSIVIEQDSRSPHHYDVPAEMQGKVIADMGAAEGFFTLDVIDQVQKAYLFECDPEWVEALKLTFAPWSDKVEIVEKYIDEKDDAQSVTLDTYFADRALDFIKADIEGYEVQMLNGGEQTLEKVSSLILCAYHKQNAEAELKQILSQHGFQVTTSPGYMFFDMYDEMQEPYLRRCLIYANK